MLSMIRMKADNHTAMVISGAAGKCSSRKRRLVLALSAVLGFALTLFCFAAVEGMSSVFPNEIRDVIYQRAESS
jgi:hypothetical protein